ncbi:queuosine precursor transporter [Flavobacterium sp. 20NA77.7]|uniref:Probable queuosine precursor transporter n=1 Tax=Flavobacterium nakdongensis TaxID=3073563 RepID=A0ABY9RB81_9FLAO|nr:queuosine precursor transporter [Flavobacterium sp. 20NA77.7]WMW77590.1 queuosine precursor transporter [Flavobacterium sp. 20NA77.7]
MLRTRKEIVYVILAGIFITNAVTAELIGGKLIQVGPFVLSMGILPWPIVFIVTDLINEYFGKQGVKRLSIITAGLISYCFIILYFAMKIPEAKGISPVSNDAFKQVFGQSNLIIIGSITAFLVAQFLDVTFFNFFKERTGNKMLWLRSTGSTVLSQLIDSFVVGGIAFYLPGIWTTSQYIEFSFTGYAFKLIIAVLLTPLIYLGHYLIEKYIHNNE